MGSKVFDFEKEINGLEQKCNIKIEDKKFAKSALSNLSYYDLIDDYKEVFAKDGDFQGISIEYLYDFYYFDHLLQTKILDYLLIVENFFKNAMSRVIGKKFGKRPEEYLDINNYDKRKNNSMLRGVLRNINNIARNPKPDFTPTSIYKKEHKDIPPHILFKNISFNEAIDLYTFLYNGDKKMVCDLLNPNISRHEGALDLVEKTLTMIRKCRNVIAHNLLFINYKSESEFFENIRNWKEFMALTKNIEHKNGYDDVYSLIVAIIYLLEDQSFTDDMIKEIAGLKDKERFKKYDDIFERYAKESGIPTDLLERYEEYKKNN
ncbi:MAG: Abi family protein [Tissierellia bacterium]|nr:Abi family protein [Tissierellia bacterium]